MARPPLRKGDTGALSLCTEEGRGWRGWKQGEAQSGGRRRRTGEAAEVHMKGSGAGPEARLPTRTMEGLSSESATAPPSGGMRTCAHACTRAHTRRQQCLLGPSGMGSDSETHCLLDTSRGAAPVVSQMLFNVLCNPRCAKSNWESSEIQRTCSLQLNIWEDWGEVMFCV